MTQANTIHFRLIKDGIVGKKCKGTWLRAEIMLNENLTLIERVIISMILGFQKGNKDCFLSDEFIGLWCHCTRTSANRIVNSLVSRKLIHKRYKRINGEMKRVLWVEC